MEHMSRESETGLPVKQEVSGQYDNVTKRGVQRDPAGFVKVFLGIDAEVLEVLETEQPMLKTHVADSFIRVSMGDEEAIVHCEFQTRDSRELPMERRMARYIGYAIAVYDVPIYSHVIYLHPRAGRKDPGVYVQEVPGYNIGIQYRVLRLAEMAGQALLDTGHVGLYPFAALMEPPAGVDAAGWLRSCVSSIASETSDESRRRERLADLAILSGLAYESDMIGKAIPRDIMQESSIIQYFTEEGIEKGIERGERRMSIESTVSILAARFPEADVSGLGARLEGISDLERLRALPIRASLVVSFDAFEADLEA